MTVTIKWMADNVKIFWLNQHFYKYYCLQPTNLVELLEVSFADSSLIISMTELAFFFHAKGRSQVQELPCQKLKCWLAFFLMARPREEDSEQENPRNLKPILILAESNNNYLRCLILLNMKLYSFLCTFTNKWTSTSHNYTLTTTCVVFWPDLKTTPLET